MASGDIVAGQPQVINPGSVNIQPAASVNIMITTLICTNSSGQMTTGSTGNVLPSPLDFENGCGNLKLFLTNTNYVGLYSLAGTVRFLYAGIEL